MSHVEQDVGRILDQLRHAIRQAGYTQLEVQEALGWGRSYLSQLLTRQKNLRVDQLLSVLGVIDVSPYDFMTEIFKPAGEARWSPEPLATGLGRLLVDKQVISGDELSALEGSSKPSLLRREQHGELDSGQEQAHGTSRRSGNAS